jgi:hypothetical protein
VTDLRMTAVFKCLSAPEAVMATASVSVCVSNRFSFAKATGVTLNFPDSFPS